VLHAYIDESRTHDQSAAVAVIAAIATPAAWEQFSKVWGRFLQKFNLLRWRQRDFDRRRNGYGALTVEQVGWARDRLCEILIEFGLFIAGAAIGRETYDRSLVGRRWRLPPQPYQLCSERCLEKVIKRVYSARDDEGVRMFYDNEAQYGRISRELVRSHRETFEPRYLSQLREREVELQFTAASGALRPFAVPDVIVFEACEYVKSDTGIPFLGAKLLAGDTPQPREIIKRSFESNRVVLAVPYVYRMVSGV
jgi:hypothetical protein